MGPRKTKKRPADSPVDARANSKARSEPQPRLNLLFFRLIMSRGVLDAVDLTALACCCKELRTAVDEAWAGIRAKNPATVLLSHHRPVADAAQNKWALSEYVPVSEAGPCIVCSDLTRFRAPIDGSLLCAACGTKAELAPMWSPLFRFRLSNAGGALKYYGIAGTVDVGRHLAYAKRLAIWADKEKKLITGGRYAPVHAPCVDEALQGIRDGIARPPSDVYYHPSGTPVVLRRDLIALLLQLYGGPRLLGERLRNRTLPALDLDKPDE